MSAPEQTFLLAACRSTCCEISGLMVTELFETYVKFTLQGKDKVANNNRKPSQAHLLKVISTQEKKKKAFSPMNDATLSGMELSPMR